MLTNNLTELIGETTTPLPLGEEMTATTYLQIGTENMETDFLSVR